MENKIQERNCVKNKNEKKENVVTQEFNEVTFVTKSGQFDLIIKVEGHKIPIVKSVLCIASPVFAAMFEGKFQEKEQTELELPGKNFEDFVEFLSCLYPDKMEPVTVRNMYRLLPYACEYQVDVMEKRCQKLILKTVRKNFINNPEEIYRHIQLAELYNLEELREKAIELASELSLKQMTEGFTKYHVSNKTEIDIKTIALARNELNTADDIYVLSNNCDAHGSCKHRGVYGDTTVQRETVTVKMYGSDLLRETLARTQNGTCKDILRGIRLNYRFNSYLSGLLYDLCNQTIEDITNYMGEIKLLPEKLKQSLEQECLKRKCSKFKDLFEC